MTAGEIIAEQLTEDVWRNYSQSNEDVNVSEDAAPSADTVTDDANRDALTDADGAAMRTTGVTWALPEHELLNETNMGNETNVDQGTNKGSVAARVLRGVAALSYITR